MLRRKILITFSMKTPTLPIKTATEEQVIHQFANSKSNCYMKFFILAVLLLSNLVLAAQNKERFDNVSYLVPKGWQKETGNGSVNHTIVNAANGHYAKLIVYKTIPGTGNLQTDFEKEWTDLVATPYQASKKPELTEETLPNNWKLKTGTSEFSFNGNRSVVILVTAVNQKNKMSLVFLTNSETYISDLEKIAGSLEFSKIKGKDPVTQSGHSTQPPVNGNYTFSSTHFDDGWTSTVQNDYVLVEKNNSSVYLNFSVPYNASQFSGTGIRDAAYYWDTYVTRQFTVKTKQFNDGSSMALKPPYMEGYATDKRTGKSCFIGMYLVIVPNAANVIIGTAPDETAFRRLFPKANDPFGSDLAAMTRYNKFAVAAKDLPGKWQNGNTSTAQWYYTSPSGYEGYAGMTLAATSATFQFNTNGTYTSIHNGATGAVGNMNTFQQEYKGTYTVNNWVISATNRYGGKNDKFDASFMAVRGGRILYLNNGKGQQYSLVKVSQENQTTASETTPSSGQTIKADSKLFGKWNRSGAVHPSYADAASWGNAGYTSSRYDFKKDGTYLFTERSFRMTHPYIIIVKENGTYKINGTQLTIIPKKSIIQRYTKKNNVDELGSIVTTQNRPLEKVTYHYQFHYFSGIQEWNLVLQADKPTLRDGNFSSNDTFQNAWYFDQKFTENDLTSPKL